MSGFPPPPQPAEPPAPSPRTGAPLPPPAAPVPDPVPTAAPDPRPLPAPGAAAFPAPVSTPTGSPSGFAPPAGVAPPDLTAPVSALPAPEFVSSAIAAPEPTAPAAPVEFWGDDTAGSPAVAELDTSPLGVDVPAASDTPGGYDMLGGYGMPGVDSSTMWDDDGPGSDADRSEIEELIARAEAEAASQGTSMPLTFSPPEGVDLRAIVAAEPVEPPRPVHDATGSTSDASGPDWLNDLVGSIEEPDADDTVDAVRPDRAATFVTADTNITVKPQKARFNGFALLSLVAAVLWVCGLGSIVAVIFSIVALAQISAVHQRGRLVALAGLVLGVMGVAAAAVLFVFDGGSESATPLSTPVAFGEVIVTSCALDAAGNGVAIVRVVNLNGEAVRYDITVAFQTGEQRAVARVETDTLDPDASEMITVISDTEFAEAPVCTLQDTVRFPVD